MSAVFISHASSDEGQALQLRERLVEDGFKSVFVSARDIQAGEIWQQQLYTKLRGCQALIALHSKAFTSSTWCFAEVVLAKVLGKRVFPVRLDKSAIGDLVRDLQAVDWFGTHDDMTRAYRELVATLNDAGILKGALEDDRSPYPGMLSFEAADAPVFFGREQAIEDGLTCLRGLSGSVPSGWFLLIGASGSGKSSLLKAGLLPRMRDDPKRWLIVGPFTPGAEPMQRMAQAFSEAFGELGNARDWIELRDLLADGDGAALADLAGDLRFAAHQGDATVVLAVDQLEELLSDERGHPRLEEERSNFAERLVLLSGLPRPFLIVATLRSDFLGPFHNHPAFRDLDPQDMVVHPVALNHLRQVIQGPAQLKGIRLEPGLVDEILCDADSGDVLPLLAFTLRELYERCADAGFFDKASYRKVGGLEHAVAEVADQVMKKAAPSPSGEDSLRIALLSLVYLGDHGQPVRRPARWNELPKESHAILERFVRARLLVSTGTGSTRQLQVAHEAFFASWPKLRAWVGDAREVLDWRRRVAHLVTDGPKQGAGLAGAALVQANRFQRRGDWWLLSPAERSLVIRSRQKVRTIRWVVGLAITVMVVLLAALRVQSVRARERIAEETELKRLDRLTEEALTDKRGDSAARFALRSHALRSSYPNLQASLSGALAEGELGYAGSEPHAQPGLVLGVLPADRVVTGDANGWLRIWNPRNPGEYDFLGVHSGLSSASILHDGTLVTGSEKKLIVWGHQCKDCVIPPPQLKLSIAAMTPVGDSAVVLAAQDGHLHLWKPMAKTTTEIGEHVGVTKLSPLGETRFASASSDGSVRLWELGSSRASRLLETFEGIAGMDAMAPTQLAVADGAGRVYVLDVEAPSAPIELGVHAGGVASLVAVPKGGVVTGGSDGRILRWRTASPGVPVPLGHCQGAVLALGALSDGAVASFSKDGRIIVWRGTRVDGRTLEATYEDAVRVIEQLDDGRWLVGSVGGRLDLWDSSAKKPFQLGTHPELTDACELPDGRIVTGAGDPAWRRAPGAKPSSAPDVRELRVWQPNRPRQFDRRPWEGVVRALVCIGPGKVVVADDHKLQLVQLDEDVPARTIGAHSYIVTAVAQVANDGIVSADTAGRVMRWDLRGRSKPKQLARLGQAIEALEVVDDGLLVFGGDAGDIATVDLLGGKTARLGRGAEIDALGTGDKGWIVSAGKNGRVQLWHRDRPGRATDLGWYGSSATAVGILDNGQVLVGDRQGRLWLSGRYHLMDVERLLALARGSLLREHLTDSEEQELGLQDSFSGESSVP